MQWSHIAPPPGYAWLEGGLKKEYSRLVKEVEAVAKVRADADQREAQFKMAYEANPGMADQSESLQTTIRALEAEIAVRDALEIFLMATDQNTIGRRQEAQGVLLQVELDERARLGIEDAMPVPIAALQCLPAWHAARRRVNQFNGGDNSQSRMEHAEAGRAAAERIKKFRSQLAAEGARLARAAEFRRRDAEQARRDEELRESLAVARDEKEDRAAALLV